MSVRACIARGNRTLTRPGPLDLHATSTRSRVSLSSGFFTGAVCSRVPSNHYGASRTDKSSVHKCNLSRVPRKEERSLIASYDAGLEKNVRMKGSPWESCGRLDGRGLGPV